MEKINYRKLGKTGLEVSKICIGCYSFGQKQWGVDEDESVKIIRKAIDLGINFFDTANVYGAGKSEIILGKALQGYRDVSVIASKVHHEVGSGPNQSGLSRLHINQQIKKSLSRLNTDYIDLYQTHRWDYNTSIEETLSALTSLVRNGKVNYIGASTMYTWQFVKSLWISDKLGLEKFVSMQNQYNLIYREEEREMIPFCMDQGIGLITYRPFAGGLLTREYKPGNENTSRYKHEIKWNAERLKRDSDREIFKRLVDISKDRGVKPSQISLAWILNKGFSIPIMGVTKIGYIEDAVEALDINLTNHEIQKLEEPYKTQSLDFEL